MVSLRLASIILASAFLASTAQGAALDKPYSPELYSRAALADDVDAIASGSLIMARSAAQPYAPELFLRQDLDDAEESDDSADDATLVKRAVVASVIQRSSPAKSTWSLFQKRDNSEEEEQHQRGLVSDEEIFKRGTCGSDSDCGSSKYCSTRNNRCYKQRANYRSCSRDGACGSGYCCESSGQCEPPRPVGQNCHQKDNACTSGYCSVRSDTCAPQQPHKGSCRVDAGCTGSLSCINGSCSNPKPSKPSHPHHPAHPAPSGSAKHPRALESL